MTGPIQETLRAIRWTFVHNAARNMAGSHLYFLSGNGKYDLAEDVLRVNTEVGYDDHGILHDTVEVHTYSMEDVAQYLLAAADDDPVQMRPYPIPVDLVSWSHPV